MTCTLFYPCYLHSAGTVSMRIGIAFPILVFIVAVAFLTWFVVGGYATPG